MPLALLPSFSVWTVSMPPAYPSAKALKFHLWLSAKDSRAVAQARSSCEGWMACPVGWAVVGPAASGARFCSLTGASGYLRSLCLSNPSAPDVAISWSCSYFWRKCSFTTVRRSLVYPFREGALSGQVLTTFELRMPAIAPPESDDSPRTRRRRRRSRPWSAAGAREAGPRCRVSQYLQVHHTAQLSIDVLMQCWLWPRPA